MPTHTILPFQTDYSTLKFFKPFTKPTSHLTFATIQQTHSGSRAWKPPSSNHRPYEVGSSSGLERSSISSVDPVGAPPSSETDPQVCRVCRGYTNPVKNKPHRYVYDTFCPDRYENANNPSDFVMCIIIGLLLLWLSHLFGREAVRSGVVEAGRRCRSEKVTDCAILY